MQHNGNGSGGVPPPSSGSVGGGAALPPESAGDHSDLKARIDRFGDLLGKGLDLAEAGLSLGLTVVGTLGAAAHKKIFEKVIDATAPDPQAAATTASAPAPAAPGAAAFGITNRLRLAPGMPVSISFSINNDSAASNKQVALRIEPFTGEKTGALLPPASLSVAPETAAVAPMDFEKFVLQGSIPENSPPDIYHGNISVNAEDAMRIPVVLVVEP
jgi:F0F1-type ATP synthase membrane subunit c/vacuolar-type H+-ATPase subunit K